MVTISIRDHIGGVLVSVPASSAVDRGFQHQSGQTKDYKIGQRDHHQTTDHRLNIECLC